MTKRTMSILCIIFALVFVGGCATGNDADANSIMRKRDNDTEVRGEVGLSYGRRT
jgi:outer membrane lipoprotein-sorting protein